ncbi:MAG TPA: DUF4389 domain-containing protein [Acidimicrobiales bacterium]|nr:DUF4389 domain-containing protein [Acidimicrobiales bacterium]
MTAPGAAAEAAPVVRVSFEGPGGQRRSTVAFRLILAIPHLLYAGVLGSVAFVVVAIGWFAALFTGRLPAGLADFLARVVQYVTQVNAYGYYLLTDRYPPFELGRSDYPVSVDVPRDVRLNRAAVLFRLVLMVPAGFVIQLLVYGLGVVVFVAWLLALMMGRLPVPLFEAFAAVLRYQVRFYAFAALLTSEYPRGLFGDRPGQVAPATDAVSTQAPYVPAYSPGGVSLGPSSTPRITALVLSKGAKWIVGLMLAFGAASTIGLAVLAATSTDTETADRLEESYARLDREAQRYGAETQRCALAGGLECLHRANRELAGAVRAFQSDLRSLDYSDVAIEDAERVDRDASDVIRTLEQMATATEPGEYDRLLRRFQSQANRLDEDFETLLESALYY